MDILIYKRLYLASYSELNDPMEVAYRIKNNVKYDCSWLQMLRSEKNDIHICSLSKSYDNILMWSHYADSHKGCCIELEVTSEKGITETPVSYVDTIKDVAGADYRDEAYQILSRKIRCWDYEKEVRFFKEIPLNSHISKYLNQKMLKYIIKLFNLPTALRIKLYPRINRMILKSHGVVFAKNIQIPGKVLWLIRGVGLR